MAEIKIDKLIRSKRRTIALEVTPSAELVVRAPAHISLEYIKNALIKKQNWITGKLILLQKRKNQHPPKKFINGESFYYLGKAYRFNLVDSNEIKLTDYLEFPRVYLPNAQHYLIQWYKAIAYQKMKERVNHYSKIIGLPYSSIKISNAEKRLGSCSARGNLNFSWRLIMAPIEIIDYVVVHELVHLEIRNHSDRFWSKVRVLLPTYSKHRAWINENRYFLDI